jgi:hypothetical protein
MIELQTAPLIVGSPTHDAEAAAKSLDFKVILQFSGCPRVTRLRCAPNDTAELYVESVLPPE